MDFVAPLPPFLVARHRERRAQLSAEHRARSVELATLGQRPQTMVVACCDSRVMMTDVFGAEAGEFFEHRNIANLVPPCTPDGQQHGTSATIEFAVTVLKVRHLIVMGHSGCGGVAGCHAMYSGDAARAPAADSFVGRWLDILAPSVPAIVEQGMGRDATLRALEHQTVLVSLRNLMTFPFVAKAVAGGTLDLHGVWKDIGDVRLSFYDGAAKAFRTL